MYRNQKDVHFIINNKAYFFLNWVSPTNGVYTSLYSYSNSSGKVLKELLRIPTTASSVSGSNAIFNIQQGGPNNDCLYFFVNELNSSNFLAEYNTTTNKLTSISSIDRYSLPWNQQYLMTPKGILFADFYNPGAQIFFFNFYDRNKYMVPGLDISIFSPSNNIGFNNYVSSGGNNVTNQGSTTLHNFVATDDGILYGTPYGAYYLKYVLSGNNVTGLQVGKISETNMEANYYQINGPPSSTTNPQYSYTGDYESCYVMNKIGQDIFFSCETFAGAANFKIFDYNITSGSLSLMANINGEYVSDIKLASYNEFILSNNTIIFNESIYYKLFRIGYDSTNSTVLFNQIGNFNGNNSTQDLILSLSLIHI